MNKYFFVILFFSSASTFLHSNLSFADPYTISIGIPQNYTFAEKNDDMGKLEDDGSRGYFVGLKFPFGIGLGIDTYKTKLKRENSYVVTEMYNIFYQLPLPVLNLTIGLGSGKSKLDCRTCSEDNTDGEGKKTGYKIGATSQWYSSIGIQLVRIIDLHVSYRSITNKKIEQDHNGKNIDISGNVSGIGIAINF